MHNEVFRKWCWNENFSNLKHIVKCTRSMSEMDADQEIQNRSVDFFVLSSGRVQFSVRIYKSEQWSDFCWLTHTPLNPNIRDKKYCRGSLWAWGACRLGLICMYMYKGFIIVTTSKPSILIVLKPPKPRSPKGGGSRQYVHFGISILKMYFIRIFVSLE